MILSNPASRRQILTRAASTTEAPKTLKALNISKNSLINAQNGSATRNVDGVIYTIEANSAGKISIVDRVNRLQYDAVVGERDNRISLVVESARPYAGNLGGGISFDQLQTVLALSSPSGPSVAEILNGRVAMSAFLGVLGTYFVTGNGFMYQIASKEGIIWASVLGIAVLAASIAPAVVGRTTVEAVFPSETDSYSDRQLPYFWTYLAEIINGRVAMVALTALLANELFRGSMFF